MGQGFLWNGQPFKECVTRKRCIMCGRRVVFPRDEGSVHSTVISLGRLVLTCKDRASCMRRKDKQGRKYESNHTDR